MGICSDGHNQKTMDRAKVLTTYSRNLRDFSVLVGNEERKMKDFCNPQVSHGLPVIIQDFWKDGR